MRTGRPTALLALTEGERETLERWARRPKSAQAIAHRARIILACAEGLNNTQVGRRLHMTMQTVGKWRSRFVQKRLDGLLDEPRPGTSQRLTDKEVEQVVSMTLESTPKDATHWYPFDGASLWTEPYECSAYLAGIRSGAAPNRDL
jgi:transposase